jgi:hypothetical protein
MYRIDIQLQKWERFLPRDKAIASKYVRANISLSPSLK